ncbi:hypothetical protein QYZ87_10735 [Porphyromonadaceae bacterium W3.11]|nr:hypothetical protein [Porphyromonadaceae bacterium W3.11]
MKNNIIHWSTLFCLLVILASCKKSTTDEVIDPNTIEVSAESISLGKMDTEAEVTVTTSAKEWDAFFSPEVTWASIKKDGDKILVHSEPNLTAEARNTAIVVMSQGAMKKISVTQSSADAVLNVSDTEVHAPISGGLLSIEINTNTKNWGLKALPEGCDWVDAKADRKAKLIFLQVAPNESTSPREVTLGVAMDGADKELSIKIIQASQLSYPIPFAKNLRVFDSGAIIKHGVENGYILGFYQPSEETWLGPSDHVFFFLTGLKKTPSITYTKGAKHPLAYEKAEVPIEDAAELLKGGEYRKFLEANGFKERHDSTEDNPKLENEDGSLWLNLKKVKDKFDSDKIIGYVAEFVPQFIQEQAYETFPQVPLGPDGLMDMLNSPKYHWSDVKKYEEERESNVLLQVLCKDADPNKEYYKNPEEMLQIFYKTKKADKYQEDYRGSLYNVTFVDKYEEHNVAPEFIQSMTKLQLCFVDYTLGVFLVDKNMYKVTREFNELLVNNGFKYLGMRPEGIMYVRPSDNLQLAVQMVLGDTARGIFEGNDKVMLLTFTRPEASIEAAAAKDDQMFYEAAMRGEYVERHHLKDVLNSKHTFEPMKKLMKF